MLLELYSSEWLRCKKEAIINGNNCFPNALNNALNYKNIETHPESIKIEPYISKYNWEGTEFPEGSKEWEKFEQNNMKIALNISFVPHNTETIRVAYRSKYNRKQKKQVISLMITNGKKCHYLVVSSLSALLEGKLSNHHGDLYCLNCFNSYSIKNSLKEHEKICNEHDRCRIEMPKWFEKILKQSWRKIIKGSIWITRKNLTRLQYHLKKLFTVN